MRREDGKNICNIDFTDTVIVCKAIHYPDQPFVVKLIHRKPGTREVLTCNYATGTYAEHSQNFKTWRSGGYEPFLLLAITDGAGYTRDNMIETWAVALDLDSAVDISAWQRSPFKPSIAIQTSEGRNQFTWILNKPLGKEDAHTFLTAFAVRFGADPVFANVTQAIRLPGFINGKHGNEVKLLDWSDGQRTYYIEDLRLAFDIDLVIRHLRSRQPRFSPKLILRKEDISEDNLVEDVKSALKFIPADGYDIWIKIGAALQSVPGGYNIWMDWSKTSTKFNHPEAASKWNLLGKMHSISVATIFSMAAAQGWSNPGFRNKSPNTDTDVGDQSTERAVGRLLAAEMRDLYAAIPNDGQSRQSHFLLQWDGEKYKALPDRERRQVIEDYVMKVRQANASNKEFVRFLIQKSANNRALDDTSEHVCGCLVDDSTAYAATGYPYYSAENGVLNLLSRQLVPAFLRPMSMVVGRVQYDPAAKADLFRTTLAQIFEGDQEIVRAVIRLFGYALLGNPKEHIMIIFYGPEGRNGKTAIVETSREIFGGYSQAIPAAVILAKSHNNEGPTPAVASLVGKRLAVISEPSDKHPLDSGFIKLMTGGEPITARHLHGPMIEFMPEFVPILVTNKIPLVREDDHALWTRLKIVKFTRTFSEAEIDTNLKAKLVFEKSGILNMLLDGIEDYRAHGLNLPAKIKSAGIEQRKEFDPFEAWYEECCQQADKATETALKAIAANYETWAQANRQHRHLSKKLLSSKLVEKDHKKVDRRNLPHFCGIMLKE